MKKQNINDIKTSEGKQIFNCFYDVEKLTKGGLSFGKPGGRSHTNDGPNGEDIHIHHDECELFVIIEGKGQLELNKAFSEVVAGDVITIEPGEDHHLISDEHAPLVVLWCH